MAILLAEMGMSLRRGVFQNHLILGLAVHENVQMDMSDS